VRAPSLFLPYPRPAFRCRKCPTPFSRFAFPARLRQVGLVDFA
jgi:hypothetical protein